MGAVVSNEAEGYNYGDALRSAGLPVPDFPGSEGDRPFDINRTLGSDRRRSVAQDATARPDLLSPAPRAQCAPLALGIALRAQKPKRRSLVGMAAGRVA